MAELAEHLAVARLRACLSGGGGGWPQHTNNNRKLHRTSVEVDPVDIQQKPDMSKLLIGGDHSPMTHTYTCTGGRKEERNEQNENNVKNERKAKPTKMSTTTATGEIMSAVIK